MGIMQDLLSQFGLSDADAPKPVSTDSPPSSSEEPGEGGGVDPAHAAPEVQPILGAEKELPSPWTEKPDRLELIVGPPKQGKSSLGAKLCELAHRRGSCVLIHDPHDQFGAFPAFRNAGAFRAAFQTAEKKKERFFLGGAIGGDCGAVVDLALELGEKWNRGRRAPLRPLYLYLDETSFLDSSSPTHIGAREQLLIMNRRHLGIELGLNLQRPSQLMVAWWDVATAVFLFRHTREDALRMMEQRLGLRRGELAGLATCPPHRYAAAVPGIGLVDPSSLLG